MLFNCALLSRSLSFFLTIHIFKAFISSACSYTSVKVAVIYRSISYLWKQVRDNSIEELQIILQELWNIDVSYGPQNNQFL